MKSLFKIELFFDESLDEAELKKLGAKIDKIFAEETITKADKTLTSRTYYDNGSKLDYGYMMEALCELKEALAIRKHIVSGFWCNGNRKENIVEGFFNYELRRS